MQKINTFIVPIIRSDFLERMLFTLYRYTPHNFNVIVIDQTTTSEAQETCQKYTQLWIKSYRNLGFSKAMNTGILLATTPYITLANDDIEFINAKWWQGILDTFAMDEKIIAVNPMSPKEGSWGYGYRSDNKDTWEPPKEYVCDPENKEYVYAKRPSGDGFLYQKEYTEGDYNFLLNNHQRYSPGTVVDSIAGFCVTWKRSCLEELGLYDERFYPGGGEDYEMSCRAYSCGYPTAREDCDPSHHRRMISTSKSWIWHHWGKSKDDLAAKNYDDPYFTSRPRWNDNSEIWGPYFDVWGHENMPDGSKKPLKRLKPVFVDEL